MPVVEESVEIECHRERIFDVSQNYRIRLDWDPFSRSYEFLDGATEVGAGVCIAGRAYNGMAMTVRMVKFDRPARAAMIMTDGPLLFASFGGSWIFRETDTGRTLVRFRYGFRTRFPLIRPVLDWLVKGILRRDVKRRLDAFKSYCEAQAL